ncbi:hypothetical protein TIFTF001_052355 [Ficus carica]|uniref:Uncharacterized protein n=1 Tax=Ficus carica TaxID=3494 RepID=A0AA88JEU2_FICCA|nr:hypothetical protein TIFTF001_052355 [Ficus carica]
MAAQRQPISEDDEETSSKIGGASAAMVSSTKSLSELDRININWLDGWAKRVSPNNQLRETSMKNMSLPYARKVVLACRANQENVVVKSRHNCEPPQIGVLSEVHHDSQRITVATVPPLFRWDSHEIAVTGVTSGFVFAIAIAIAIQSPVGDSSRLPGDYSYCHTSPSPSP